MGQGKTCCNRCLDKDTQARIQVIAAEFPGIRSAAGPASAPSKAPANQPNIFGQAQVGRPGGGGGGGGVLSTAAWASSDAVSSDMLLPPPPPDFHNGGADRGAPTGNTPTSEITFDMVLVNLDGAEEAVYSGVFMDLAHGAPTLPHDNEENRTFLALHTALGEDLDGVLFTVAPEGGLRNDTFLQVLRDQAVAQDAVLEHFMSLCGDSDVVRPEDCRSALLNFAQMQLPANFDNGQWESILDTVMMNTDFNVTLDQWMICCNIIGRTVRLMHYLQL